MPGFKRTLHHRGILTGAIAALVVMTGSLTAATDSAQQVSNTLELTGFHHIPFDDIPANQVAISPESISIDVDSSASFLLQGLREIMPVRQVTVEWSATGRPTLDDAEHEAGKSGDDAVMKVALMLSGEPSGFTWFLPDWIKEARKKLFHPADEMLYLVADARHSAGSIWPNPYNDEILMYAMSNEQGDDGVWRSSYRFSEPVDAVAVWLMADGDNTGAAFSTTIKRIELN